MTTTRTSMQVAEDIIRGIMRTFPEKPIRASFYRGVGSAPDHTYVKNETVETPSASDGRFVFLSPGDLDVAISAQEQTPFGPDTIGRVVADCLGYPRVGDGDEVDLAALAGLDFQCRLMDAIDEKIAVIKAARA
jgi:hypothetical protein